MIVFLMQSINAQCIQQAYQTLIKIIWNYKLQRYSTTPLHNLMLETNSTFFKKSEIISFSTICLFGGSDTITSLKGQSTHDNNT